MQYVNARIRGEVAEDMDTNVLIHDIVGVFCQNSKLVMI